MVKVILQPKLRSEGIILQCQDADMFKKKQTYIALSSRDPKMYSFMVMINDIKWGLEKMPILEMDKRRTGILASGDTVDLYPWPIPEADRVIIGISTAYKTITPGTWTKTFLPVLLNRVLDGGDSANFPVAIGKDTTIVQGTFIESRPKFPVKVGSSTIIEVKKIDDKDLAKILDAIEHLKIDRTKSIEKTVKKDNAELIGKIRSGQYGTVMKKIEFNDVESIKALDLQIKQTLSGLECFEENVIEDKAAYSAHRSFVIMTQEEPTSVIEYQISGTNDKGVIQLCVNALDSDVATALANKYDDAIHDQASGLQIGVESGELQCACGANLPLDRMDVKTGLVTCEYCHQKSMVPRKYRY
ncbi:MAG TPA: hypothetical protein VKM55_14410 [Candidatus Lokiarchaeia archaeon]|nr:hypothetical protein [Candidatus Lokiarchaeia archaeon]